MVRCPSFVLTLIIIFLGGNFRADAAEREFVVVGYLPDYRIESCSPEQFAGVTDLVYFSLRPDANGHLPEAAVSEAVLQKLYAIKRLHKCRLLITVGGWDRSEGFPSIAKNQKTRAPFIAELLTFCRTHKFDGVDFDWEHPKDETELAAYGQLLAETKQNFRKHKLLVTIAQAGWQDIGKAGYQGVDRVHLMSYDHDYPQATLEKSQAEVKQLIDWGCPPAKIALGLPFYGRNEKGDARTYAELNAEGKLDPASDAVDGFAFNGEATIRAKIDFAFDQKLKGVMIWELGQDVP
ncbi:MAG: glycoside hydrolase family 18 protein, partial [Planctomycetaceae bacterium]